MLSGLRSLLLAGKLVDREIWHPNLSSFLYRKYDQICSLVIKTVPFSFGYSILDPASRTSGVLDPRQNQMSNETKHIPVLL